MSRLTSSLAPLNEPLPELFRGVYSASVFLARLSLHAGEPLGAGIERWSPLSDWWRRQEGQTAPVIVAAKRHVLAHAAQIARDVETLRTWTPPEAPLPGTAYATLFENLAQKYLDHRDNPEIRGCPPGPLGGNRHPGFDLAWDPRRSVFEAREERSALISERLRFAFMLPLPSRTVPQLLDGALPALQTADAWELFALREILIALHERREGAVVALERELGRPMWDQVLDHLGRTQSGEVREWAFCILPTYRHHDFKLAAFARRESAKPGGWKKQTFEAMYAEEATPALREIARVAMCALERPTEAKFTLGTPHGHELLRALAQHPRVHHSAARPEPDKDPLAEIAAGDLTMRMERAPNGIVSPRFLVGDVELAAPVLGGATSDAFRGMTRALTITSAFVPPSLRAWVSAAEKMGTALAFPPESVSKLATATQSLIEAGVAELPRDALGAELTYTPAAALRVEWHPEGGAVIGIFISVHDGAPLIAAGLGPKLFTFVETGGRRVFVERELARELEIVEDARSRIAAPVTWNGGTGRTDSLEEAVLLAAWLDSNPLELAIEVKIGRAPTVTPWEEAGGRTLQVQRTGAWLVLDGELDVKGAKLTLGDVLEAARLARRYVKAADGVFLELSQEAIAKLQPVAFAADLAATKTEKGDRMHDAFGSILKDASSLFAKVNGADLDIYAKRFEARKDKVRVPSLDHGELRPYQHEGVAWMLRLASWAPGCVLADDMGLGKTVQTAVVLKARSKIGPQLIVAPASVSSNWMSELARFVPSLHASWFNDDRAIDLAGLGPGDVLVVSYGLLQRESAAFEKQKWATVVVDEAQYVKNVAAQRTDAIRQLPRDFTIALTGTPLENHLGELFSITDLVFPGLLGVEPTFRERFRRPIEGHRDETRLAVLARLLSPFLLRRTRANVLADLPPREEITEYINLSPAEVKRYLALRRACEEQFAKRKKEETSAQLKIALFAALTRLRQLACEVRLVNPTFDGPSTKIARTVDIATSLAAEGNHALVFSQFTSFLERIKLALEEAGLRVAYLAGDTPTKKRKAIIDAFQAGEFDVFCVSLLAGGTGLNLTRASYVIHTDPWWNPAAEEQATSRAHRMGQTDPVTVYRMVARGTIEEAVLAMHASKKELAAAVLEGKSSGNAITSSELLDLLRFGG